MAEGPGPAIVARRLPTYLRDLYRHPKHDLFRGIRLRTTAISTRRLDPTAYLSDRYRPTFLISTSGYCANEGEPTARAGCGFVVLPNFFYERLTLGSWMFCLELRGHDGSSYLHTSRRAELRAVIAALQTYPWNDEHWPRIIIATDSEFVVEGISCGLGKWLQKGWVESEEFVSKEPVSDKKSLWKRIREYFPKRWRRSKYLNNQDLWQLFLVELHRLNSLGVEVYMWKISREQNHEAIAAAKTGADMNQHRDFTQTGRFELIYTDEEH